MFKENFSAVEKAFMFSWSDFNKTILVVVPEGKSYTVSTRLFSSKWKGIYINRITKSMIHFVKKSERAHEYDMAFLWE